MSISKIIKQILPVPIIRCIRSWQLKLDYWPLIGWKRLGRLHPVSRVFGLDRGTPIDRYYIEKFLEKQKADIYGHVLEFGDRHYTVRFGGKRVTKSDVLHALEGNPQATIVADITKAENIPSNVFDCIICTQTVFFIYDMRSAIQTLHRILKPGGVLLVTVAGISQISRYDMDRWGDYWRFTNLSAKRLFTEFFPEKNVGINTFGNVLTATAFLQGVAMEELSRKELDHMDPDYQVSISIRAIK